jgi:hypothetical protein
MLLESASSLSVGNEERGENKLFIKELSQSRVKFTEAVVEFIEKKSIDTEHAWNLTSTPEWKFGSNN